MFRLQDFSNTLLDLQCVAQEKAVDQYQDAALSLVQRILPFDKAWWGIMSAHEDSFLLHCSHAYQLPPGFVPMWEVIKTDDNVAKSVRERPKTTVYFDERKLSETPGLAVLTGEHDIAQAFCTSSYLPAESAFVFLSLYRSSGELRFTADERLLKQYLMPHLCSSWAANRIFQMEYLKASVAHEQTAMSLVDLQFQILNAEPGFADVLHVQWPDWEGNELPSVVVSWLRSPDDSLKLGQVVMRRYCLGELCLIAARERMRVDLLSKREAVIADAFSRGHSYKEIARDLEISPATVRHHLRRIYEKLNVSDKAEMTCMLHEQDILLEEGELMRRYRKLERKHFF
ncbi:MAG: LuxR C-terminal-related transcriptional regulator [Burkholderiales bacterium]